ncbi:BTAD domain-containing putative transcriptional regulator [Amycolatopsis sp. TNS106]|uniref:BTAD domain-containing putative transcriptional regulator n=1 Tax=Amycolatopsis sp. TNS106 TaxID=2861750 RepID=UPI001C58DDDB|nr:BTAD domain-containing putative transcriptional regulator [Amycolatopsis sp. TNS106]QXV60450.1 AfsR family transcriptional regulator [Amycolatopsis sp. TNS106]
MRFGVLGATEVRRDDGAAVPIGGPRVRTLLALLALEAGRIVPAERLIDGLYGEQPPEGVANALQSQVSRLRGALKELAPVEFSPAGYRLVVDPDDVDVHRFERLATEGRRALTAGDAAKAAELLRDALALWRGPAFADITDAPFRDPQVARLNELKTSAIEDRAEAELKLGRHEGVLAQLREVVDEQPLRERLRALLIRALHAAGRQADALTAFEEARRVLADELGADPGPDLAAAHLAVLRGETPPVKTAPIETTALPAQLTSFIGREGDLRHLLGRLESSRLVTLTGPGGAGKTRLAIETAAAVDLPAVFVELAPYTEDADVAHAVLTALGLRTVPLGTVTAPVENAPLERLIDALADRAVLLVLDNCEHLVEGAAKLAARLLGAAPALRVLATSREPLGITGEVVSPVPRLAVPPPGTPPARSLEFAAVRLFADRARAGDPGFTVDEDTAGDVQRVCAALDGLPLAIELAAARVRTLPVGEIAARLGSWPLGGKAHLEGDDRFGLLSRGSRVAESRHRTLRAVVEWSWDLLDEDERLLARRLTVFAGGTTLADAEAVCAVPDIAELLPSLVDRSLVERTGNRYRMLETIRAFFAGKLAEAGETEHLRRAHAEHFLALAEKADPLLRTGEQLVWLDRLDAAYDDLLAALRWAADSDVRIALRLSASLVTYWWMRGRRFEGSTLCLEVVKRLGERAPDGLEEEYQLCVLTAAAGLRGHEALDRHLPLVDGLMLSLVKAPRNPALLLLMGVVTGPPGDDDALIERSRVLLANSDAWSLALAPTGYGLRALMQGDLGTAEEFLREGAQAFRSLGERWGLSMALDHLSQILIWTNRQAEALETMNEALRLMRELGASDDNADLLCRRGGSKLLHGDAAGARADFELAIEIARRAGMPESRAAGYVGLSLLARHEGDLAAARALSERALAECPGGSFAAEGVRAGAKISLGWVLAAEGDVDGAEELHRLALVSADRWHDSITMACAVEGLAGVALIRGDAERAAVLIGAAVTIRGTPFAVDLDAALLRTTVRERLGDDFDRAYRRGLGLRDTAQLP